MTSDERLGANPLAWVEPKGETNTHIEPEAAPAHEAESAPAKDHDTGKSIVFPAKGIAEEHAMSKSKVKIEQVIETKQVVKHLSDLAKSLESGVIRAEDAENSVVLHVPDMMQFEMKVSRKKDKGKCALELTWKDDGTRDEVFKVTEA